MADNYRYRWGDTAPVQIPWKAGVVLSIGDMVYVDTADGGTAKPLSVFPWTTDLPTTQGNVTATFAGVCAQRYDGTTPGGNYGVKDGVVRVNTWGTYEFQCAPGSNFQAGDLVGPDKDVGNNLLSQQVVAVGVANKNRGVGRVVQQTLNASTVLVEIFPARFNIGFN